MRRRSLSRRLPQVSRTTLAALLLAVPASAGAQGFAGSAVVAKGAASFSVVGGVQTISIPTSSPVTTINWTPTDTAVGAAPVNFLPTGNSVNYVGAAGAAVPYTVLNRIIPADTTRTVAFNGSVTSSANTRVWFYSPGGLLIGATASFNVGGLVLTTADPAIDANGKYITTTAGTDTFSLNGAAGSTSAITIQPGATISAISSGQSNYIVALAPQIIQGGTIGVAGSVALVAAESASFAVDSHGLFNISVTSGSGVASNTLVHFGTTGGPNAAAAAGDYQRVYLVAVPKNDAVAMAIGSGGSIGFAVAGAANVDGNEIVLSAGSNIADTGSGNPVVAGRAGSGSASLAVGAGNFTSNTYAVATDSATITDPVGSIGFSSNLAVVAPQATVNAQVGTISVGGNLTVTADNSVDGATQTALVAAAPGASLAIGTNAAALGVNGGLTETASDDLNGAGGSAILQAGGTITIAGNTLIGADGTWGANAQNSGLITTQGGTAQVMVGGKLAIGGNLLVSAVGDGTGADAALATEEYYDPGLDGVGGTASVKASGSAASLSVANGITARANGISGLDSGGNGGQATGGQALIEAQSGALLTVGMNGAITATANASPTTTVLAAEGDSAGGQSIGGTAQVIADAATIRLTGVNGITASATAVGGTGSGYYGGAGSAFGGTALIATRGANGMIATNTGGANVATAAVTAVDASATGGYSTDYSTGGSATGGLATLQVTATGQSVAIDHGAQLSITAQATGGAGSGQGGGSATGGTAQLLADGGSIAITNTALSLNAGATGGSDEFGNGASASGGTVRFGVSDGGTINAAIATVLGASATGGNGSGSGGNALGGNIFIALGNNEINFDAAGSTPQLDASATGGTSESYGTPGTTGSAGGVLLTDLGTVSLAGGLAIAGNTPLYVQADGSIQVPGSITATGAGAYLHLWADDLGTGAGTVTLADDALNLPGGQVDLYYNPATLGIPTDFSAGVKAGYWTGYQLVDTVTQLQAAGSHLAQNFALGRDIDASATQGWNAGAGFVPIGSSAAPFTGNFDGLGHTITALYIDRPGGREVGLFGQVGAGTGANIVIRNVGLVNVQVKSDFGVGGLIGTVGASSDSTLDNVTVTNSYTTGSVTGNTGVGGLIGDTLNTSNVTLTNVHSDAGITLSGPGSFDNGGLVGAIQVSGGNAATISDAFATGAITGTASAIADVGGLIGNNGGALSQAYAAGTITLGTNALNVGGLVGTSSGTITQAYATGTVIAGTGSNRVAGLAGYNVGSIEESWASSPVSAAASSNVSGFVGVNAATGTITNSYWDTFSSGQPNGVGTSSGAISQLNSVTSDPTQAGADNYAFGSYAYGSFSGRNWVYDNDDTRPVGAWEIPVAFFGVANVASAHQVQLIDYNLGGNYRITQNIDMRGTAGTTDIWDVGGFMPLGQGQEDVDPPFAGTLAGTGHVLSNLTMSPDSGFFNAGLIQENEGVISDLGLANVTINAANSYEIGAIAGISSGQITDSFATGTITLSGLSAQYGEAGGLLGLNIGGGGDGVYGTVTRSYASVAVTGGQTVGGLAGSNEGGISETFANGKVSGAVAGGLIGAEVAGAAITTSYWDTQASGQALACGSGLCSGTTGLTTAQTLQAASFTGFSIDTQGGLGLPWRQYQGQTTPLLEAFLTPITVQPDSLTQQYDGLTPDIGVTTYGAQPALISGTPLLGGVTRNAGISYITYTGGLYSSQLGYDFVASGTPGVLDINPAPLTLAAVSATRVYNATTASAGIVQASGLYGTDNVTSLAQHYTSPNVLGANGSTLLVNNGYIINDGNGGGNYTVTVQSATGTITPAALAITYIANPVSSIYGNAITGLSGTLGAAGLQGGDTLASVTLGTAGFTTSATALSNVGNYAVTGAGVSGNSSNYTFSFAQASGNAAALAVVARALTLTANPLSRVYGAANPVSDTATAAPATATTGLVNGNTVTGEAVTSPATAGSGVGTYALNGSAAQFGSGLAGNYAITYAVTPNGLSITPALATIAYVANPASIIYGTVPSGLSGSEVASGLVNGDTLASVIAGSASFTTSATALSNVGSYAVTGSGLSGNSGNYSFSFVQASGNANALAIVARALTLTADPLSRIYGAANPGSDTATAAPATATTGLVNGDSIITETVSSPAGVGSGVGTYALNGSGAQFGAGLAGNYAITYAVNPNGLSITPAALTVTYTATPGTSIYGIAPKGLTGGFAVTGLVNGDAAASVTGGTAQWSTPATAASNVGSYAINGSGIVLTSANYALTTVQAPGNATALTINPAALTILYTADSASRSYGATNPALSGNETTNGLANGDTLAGVTSGTAAFTSPANATSNVGGYAIVGSGLTGSSANYTYSYVQAVGNGSALTIVPALATITYTADPLRSIYGNPPGVSGGESAAGLVNGDTVGSVTSGTASYATAATGQSGVGSYAVTGAGLTGDSGNYSISFVQAPGNASALTIVPRPITVTADAQQRQFGALNPALTYAVTGPGEEVQGYPAPALVNGDRLTGQLATGASITSRPGSYAITQGTLAASPDYQLTYVGNVLTILSPSVPLVQVTETIEANLPGQPGDTSPTSRRRRREAELAGLYAALGLRSADIAQSVINDLPVTTPAPVSEPVTSNGNTSLWGRGTR